METSITSKGQIVIPSAIRRLFDIKPGTRFAVEADESTRRIVLTPITENYVREQQGRYRGRNLLGALAAEKQRERSR